jgi:hypothetical protein
MSIAAFSKLKKSRLGAPPTDENPQIVADLSDEPKILPASPSEPEPRAAGARSVSAKPAARPSPSQPPIERIDGRTLRRTGRTLQFATRVTPEFDAQVRQLAQEEGRLIVEILEAALEVYRQYRR